jgi:ABC-type nitrate/sulfonate/bicarbonate transport system permease component
MGRLTILLWQLLSLTVLGLAWEAAVRWDIVDRLFVPSPTATATAMMSIVGEALPRLAETLLKTLLGYGLAVGLGVGAGVIIGSTRTLHQVLMPYVVALYSVPKILIIPWIALIFGVGLATATLSAALFAFFPIAVLVAGAVRDLDPTLTTVAVSMGASRWQVYRKVILPAIVPSTVAGMRIGIVFAMLGALLAEMLAGIRGMGFFLQRLALAFRAPELFAATALVSAFSIVVIFSLESLNRRLGRWRQ